MCKYAQEAKKAEESKELLGIEGYASKIFFQSYFKNVPWKRREPRNKSDSINFLLDMGYTHLFNFMEAHLRLYGFDVYIGIYHTLFYQRKSLVCDLVEPFRCIIDHSLRKAYALKQIKEKDFIVKRGRYFLPIQASKGYSQILLEALLKHKEEIFLYTQKYYRCFIKQAPVDTFPDFYI